MKIILALDNISIIPFEGKTIKYQNKNGEYIEMLIDHICTSLNEVNSFYWYNNSIKTLLTYVLPSNYFGSNKYVSVVLNSGIIVELTEEQLNDLQYLYNIQKKYLEEYDEYADYATPFTDELVKILTGKNIDIKGISKEIKRGNER